MHITATHKHSTIIERTYKRKIKIMDSKTVDQLDEKITEIRIELQKGTSKDKLDLMLYNLQIAIFKLEDN